MSRHADWIKLAARLLLGCALVLLLAWIFGTMAAHVPACGSHEFHRCHSVFEWLTDEWLSVVRR